MRGLCPRAPGIYRFRARMWLALGRLAPPHHSGRWVGAPVASLRSRTLRPGEVSINQAASDQKTQIKKKLAGPGTRGVKPSCSGCGPLAGFGVSMTGRFSGVHRGPNQVIPADDLARATVDVAVREAAERGGVVLENRDIRAMVKSL